MTASGKLQLSTWSSRISPNNRMQSDIFTRYARENAADARRYVNIRAMELES